jgi:hypothetical protein
MSLSWYPKDHGANIDSRAWWGISLVAYNPSTETESTLYFGTGPLIDGSGNRYESRIVQPCAYTVSIFDYPGSTLGRARGSSGEVILANKDGGLDYLIDYLIDGRTVKGWFITSSSALDSYFSALGEGFEVHEDRVIIRFRDTQPWIDKPLNTNKFLGNNVLPDGLEGVEGDLRGHPKPVLFGKVQNITPPCVNTSKLIYMVHDASTAELRTAYLDPANDVYMDDVTKAYDQGSELTKGTDYTDEYDMVNNAPSAGWYRVWPGGGYFRVGSSPTGLITCDAQRGVSATYRTPAQIFKQMILQAWGIASWVSSEITALDTVASFETGYWFDEDIRVPECLDLVVRDAGAWWGSDLGGFHRILQLTDPEDGTSVRTYTERDLVKPIRRIIAPDALRGIPPYRTIVEYSKNYTIQDFNT